MTVRSGFIVRRASMNLSRRTVHRAFRSTPRIAFTARHATSRTRPRTSTGSHPKAEEAPITRTCRMKAALLAGLAAMAAPVAASAPETNAGQLSTYVTARAADALGDPARAAVLYANLSRERP